MKAEILTILFALIGYIKPQKEKQEKKKMRSRIHKSHYENFMEDSKELKKMLTE